MGLNFLLFHLIFAVQTCSGLRCFLLCGFALYCSALGRLRCFLICGLALYCSALGRLRYFLWLSCVWDYVLSLPLVLTKTCSACVHCWPFLLITIPDFQLTSTYLFKLKKIRVEVCIIIMIFNCTYNFYGISLKTSNSYLLFKSTILETTFM